MSLNRPDIYIYKSSAQSLAVFANSPVRRSHLRPTQCSTPLCHTWHQQPRQHPPELQRSLCMLAETAAPSTLQLPKDPRLCLDSKAGFVKGTAAPLNKQKSKIKATVILTSKWVIAVPHLACSPVHFQSSNRCLGVGPALTYVFCVCICAYTCLYVNWYRNMSCT